MKHHLNELRILAETGEYDRLKEYICAMTDEAQVLNNMIGTGNVALDGILNYMKDNSTRRCSMVMVWLM